jgi:hypothetical protein
MTNNVIVVLRLDIKKVSIIYRPGVINEYNNHITFPK